MERGEPLGRTGATGLAGGDHLHFTTLVRGLPVNPIEWWDDAWIRDRVASKVGPRCSPSPYAEALRPSSLDLPLDLHEGLADLLRGGSRSCVTRLLPLELGLREAQRVQLAVTLRIGRRHALPLLLLLTLGHPLLEAVLGVDQSFTGVAHRPS